MTDTNAVTKALGRRVIHAQLLKGEGAIPSVVALWNGTGNRIDVETEDELDELVEQLHRCRQEWAKHNERITRS
jgi:hypothetical protein